MSEQVLCVPRTTLFAFDYFQGFRPDEGRQDAVTIIRAENCSYQPRDAAEIDPCYKQVIPYVILWHSASGQVFAYRRDKNVGEQRLAGKMSVGIGGHVNPEDGPAGLTALIAGEKREVTEEVELGCAYRRDSAGLISDDRTLVGQVHLGVVLLYNLSEPKVTLRDTQLSQGGFERVPELLKRVDEFESWSQFVLGWLLGR